MLAIAVVAGGFIGLSLGALGGGGSILAVPVLVYLLGQTPVAATTGSLLIVGVSSLTGAVAAWRAGNVDLVRGLAFGATGIAGAALGAMLSVHVDPTLLLALFACLMLVVAAVMAAGSYAAVTPPVRVAARGWRSRSSGSVPASCATARSPPRSWSPVQQSA